MALLNKYSLMKRIEKNYTWHPIIIQKYEYNKSLDIDDKRIKIYSKDSFH